MLRKNIIQRRDLEPLWNRATEVVQHYEKAANCIAAVIGPDCVAVEHSRHPKAVLFCQLCKRYYRHAEKLASHEVPCSSMHLAAVQEARKLGGSYIYTCPIGFFFWTSPFFAGDRFAGALTSSGAIAIDAQQIADRIFIVCKGDISHAEISHYLDGIPERGKEDIKALAQMMLLCAESISSRESPWDDLVENGVKQGCPSYKLYYLDLERSLVASLRRGDHDEARNTLRTMLKKMSAAASGNVGCFKLKVMELVVMLSRTTANSKNDEDLILSNNRYLKRIEDSKTAEEVCANMNMVLDQMSAKLFSFKGIRHSSALRKAERFIWENYNRKISLKEIADVSGLSAPYFSTIFKDEMGENLSNYLNRLRVEKASAMLRETDNPIRGISTACGFEDQSWFSKVFKNYTGMSPCKYREQGGDIENVESQ